MNEGKKKESGSKKQELVKTEGKKERGDLLLLLRRQKINKCTECESNS